MKDKIGSCFYKLPDIVLDKEPESGVKIGLPGDYSTGEEKSKMLKETLRS